MPVIESMLRRLASTCRWTRQWVPAFGGLLVLTAACPAHSQTPRDIPVFAITGLNGLEWLIPGNPGDSAQTALARYQQALLNDTEIGARLQASPHARDALIALRMGVAGAKLVSPADIRGGFIVIANSVDDFSLNAYRLRTVTSGFEAQGQRPLIVPLAADLGLMPDISSLYIDRLVDEASLILTLGGDDIEPELYRERNLFAENTLRARDRFELRLVGRYLRRGLGFLSGICRGHQLTAVAAGYPLDQDLPRQRQTHRHSQSLHAIMFPNLFKHSLRHLHGADTDSLVNSWHHQAVRIPVTPVAHPLHVAAFSPEDGVVEALVGRRVLTTQYHWELLPPAMRNRYVDYLVARAQKHRQPATRCFSLLEPRGSVSE